MFSAMKKKTTSTSISWKKEIVIRACFCPFLYSVYILMNTDENFKTPQSQHYEASKKKNDDSILSTNNN